MWSLAVVEGNVFLQNPLDLTSANQQKIVQRLSSHSSEESLHDSFSDDLEILWDNQDEHAIMIEVRTRFPSSKRESLGRRISHVSKSDDVSLVYE
jgi:hypothetical protein